MGILIFSLGILTLVAMQTAAISAQSDAQYRILAADLASQIVSDIWLNVDRSNPAPPFTTVQPVPPNLSASLAAFQHNATGAPNTCNFSGTASANALVTAWVNTVLGAGPEGSLGGLPSATAAMQQIAVNGAYNQVTVTLCWKAPLDASPHWHTVRSFIN